MKKNEMAGFLKVKQKKWKKNEWEERYNSKRYFQKSIVTEKV